MSEALMGAAPADCLNVLLIEDDDADALLVEMLMEQDAREVRMERCLTLRDALVALRGDLDCVLLDLGLPDGVGIDTVRRVRAAAPNVAVIVLTGLDNEGAGVAAVDAGAQDYLVKGKVDGALLARAIRYAIGRAQAEDARQRLQIAELQARENARLERGLVPRPIVRSGTVQVASIYRPGRARALVGGDFFDVVETDDGVLHVLIGDVAGHGPDEAALGAGLRFSWRALTLASASPVDTLEALERVIAHERQSEDTFATLCMLEIEPDHATATVRRAGHPTPLVIDGAQVTSLPQAGGGPPLGTFSDSIWQPSPQKLPHGWALLLFTDGIVEGSKNGGAQRLGEAGLCELVAEFVTVHPAWRDEPDALLAWVLARATEENGEALIDDVALLLVSAGASPP